MFVSRFYVSIKWKALETKSNPFNWQIIFLVYPGFSFPVLKEADAMFMAEKAPEWKDGEVCTRCRVQFSMVQRRVSNLTEVKWEEN